CHLSGAEWRSSSAVRDGELLLRSGMSSSGIMGRLWVACRPTWTRSFAGVRTTPLFGIWSWEGRVSGWSLRKRIRAVWMSKISPIFTVRLKLRSMRLDLLLKANSRVRTSQLAVLCRTTAFMYWTIVWSRLELGLLGSFTYRGAE